jgi:diphthamide biosynthesis protein 3
MSYYDEIEIEDMTYDKTLELYHYPCPCGDRFEISLGDLRDGENVAVCPSCSLMIKVVFEAVRRCGHPKDADGAMTDEFTQSDLPEEDPPKVEDAAQQPIVAA